MSFVNVAPMLLSLLVGVLLGLVTWEFLRTRRQEVGDALMSAQDEFLIGLLVLAAFALGVFLAYLLLSTNF
ncbi:MAG: hypothetical protein D6791_03005 [Chloroflexi bacterium]|nr:MAG: hypothetical protein D6791_03005 [Chloroflexota bacterium]